VISGIGAKPGRPWRDAAGPRVEKADGSLGITTEILDIHDGELLPSLENRRMITRLIREWKADIVMSHRPNDYHPDHRYTGVLIQDAAYMVTVPGFCPDSPILTNNPAFFYYSDRFQKPNPFKPDVVVDIGPVMEKKLDALGIMVSQFAEGGANGYEGLMPADPEGQSGGIVKFATACPDATNPWPIDSERIWWSITARKAGM
jgi:LmbE family N-acetylglucosaminyl deacetylase